MYNVKTTGNEGINYCDIPSGYHNSMSLKIGKKFAKELLNGRLAIIPVQASGGGFKEKGDYTMPVQIGLLTDGEKILGRVWNLLDDLLSLAPAGTRGIPANSPIHG